MSIYVLILFFVTNKCTLEKLFINIPFIFLHHVANVIFFISLWTFGMKMVFSIWGLVQDQHEYLVLMLSVFCSATLAKSVCILLCCTQNFSLLRTLAQYSYSEQTSHRSGCAVITLDHNGIHFSQQCYKVFLQLSQSSNKLQLVVIDFENITVNYSRFFFLLARKDTVDAECLQLLTAWASCYIFRVNVFRAQLPYSLYFQHQHSSERFSNSNSSVWISCLFINKSLLGCCRLSCNKVRFLYWLSLFTVF